MRGIVSAVVACSLAFSGCRSPEREGVDEQFNFLPIARYETSERPAGYAVDVLWPLVRFHREGDAHGSRLFPLWIHEDDGEGEDFLNLGLLYWRTDDERTDTVERTLFPVFFQAKGPHRDKLHVWPLYGIDRYGGPAAPARTDTVLGPVFEWDRSLDDERSRVSLLALWPLFAVFRHDRSDWTADDGESHRNRELHLGTILDELFALAHHRRLHLVVNGEEVVDRETEVLRVLDLFRAFERSRDDGRFRTRFVGLLDEPWAALYARFGEVDENGEVVEEWNHLFPVWFHDENRQRELRVLFPLFGRLDEESGRTKSWLVPPLFALERDPRTDLVAVDAPWPLWRYENRAGDDPAWHLRLLPLLWFTKRPSADVEVVLPLWYRIRDERSEMVHLVPLWGRHEEDDGAFVRTFWVPPVLIRTEDAREDLDRTDVLWPLASFGSSDAGTHHRVFPLFWFDAAGEERHLNVLGAFDRRTDGERSQTILWPVLGTARADDATRTSVLPLLDARFLSSAGTSGTETSVLWPLASFRRFEDHVARWIFPVFWWFEDGSSESHRHLWPLVGRDEEDGLVLWSTLFPFFQHGGSADGSRSRTRFLWPLGGSRRDEGRATRWFFPLFYDRTADAAPDLPPDAVPEEKRLSPSRRTWVLWPLFSREASPDGSSCWHSLFALARREHDPARERTEFTLLGGIYRDLTEGTRTTRSLAFLFRFEEDGEENELRLFHVLPIRW